MKKLAWVLLVVLMSACSTKSARELLPRWAGGVQVSSFQARPHRIVTLENGMKIFFVKDDTLPLVSLIGLFRVGMRDEPVEMTGINSLTASLIDQGTKSFSASKLADEFNALGTEFAVSPGLDGTFTSASTVSTEAEALLKMYAEVLFNPLFSEKELARTKSLYLAAWQKRKDNPSSYASKEFDELLFGGHPYGRNSYGTDQTISKIQRSDIIRQYLTYYRPNRFTLGVTGRFDEDFEKKVVATFEKWSAREVKSIDVPPPAKTENFEFRFLAKRGLEQTQIRMGAIALPRKDPDFLALSVGVEALGGGFSSRLMQKVRDDLALTYSISAWTEGRREAGTMEITTFTKNESAGRAVEEILKIYDELVEGGITEAELLSAKAQVIGQYPRSIETPSAVTSTLLLLDLQGVPLSEINDYPRKVESLTLKQVNAALKKHLKKGALKVLVYGDEKVVGPQMMKWKN